MLTTSQTTGPRCTYAVDSYHRCNIICYLLNIQSDISKEEEEEVESEEVEEETMRDLDPVKEVNYFTIVKIYFRK